MRRIKTQPSMTAGVSTGMNQACISKVRLEAQAFGTWLSNDLISVSKEYRYYIICKGNAEG